MSDTMTGPKYSEREYVLAQREAFLQGAAHGREYAHVPSKCGQVGCASRRYPLKVTRPRVVRDSGPMGSSEWRYVNGRLECRLTGAMEWDVADGEDGTCKMFIRAERVKLLADLIANPTEEVAE